MECSIRQDYQSGSPLVKITYSSLSDDWDKYRFSFYYQVAGRRSRDSMVVGFII